MLKWRKSVIRGNWKEVDAGSAVIVQEPHLLLSRKIRQENLHMAKGINIFLFFNRNKSDPPWALFGQL